VCSVADILTALSLRGVIPPPPSRSAEVGGQVSDDLGDDRAVFEALSSDPVSLDHLVRSTGLDISALCGGLERLARAGVARDVGGWWERT